MTDVTIPHYMRCLHLPKCPNFTDMQNEERLNFNSHFGIL